MHAAHDWQTRGMYAWLSNASHPTPAVAREMAVPFGGAHRFALDDVTYPYRLVRAGMMTFLRGWQLLAGYLGVDQDEPGTLGEEIGALPEP